MRSLAPLLLVFTSCIMSSMPGPDPLERRCVGSWTFAPHARWQGPPPPGFTDLEIALDVGAPDDAPRGTVSWNGVAWPMQLEWSDSGPFVRYEAGAPFADPANPDGIAFTMLRHSSDKPHWDEIYVDFRRVGAREDEPLQNGWCRFIRE